MFIHKKTHKQRERRLEMWRKPGKSFTIYVHGWQTPNGYLRDVDRPTKKPRWVAMNLDAYFPADSPARWRSEIFETKQEALDYAVATYWGKKAAGWSLADAYVVPTVVVRKRRTQTSAVEFDLPTPEQWG